MSDSGYRTPTQSVLGGLFGLGQPAPGPATLGLLGQLGAPPRGLLAKTDDRAPAHVNRRAFFSFHYDDVMRVNNVRKAYEFTKVNGQTPPKFVDSSLWESKKLTSPDAIKNLIRFGVGYTSAVCVLVGAETWAREWVRYEIARAVIDNRGLLAVHLNGLNHHSGRGQDPHGPNPLRYMGVYKKVSGILQPATWHLCEWTSQGWVPYLNHTAAVERPQYLPDAAPGVAVPLSDGTGEYCYATQLGCWLIGKWIDHAAKAVGR